MEARVRGTKFSIAVLTIASALTIPITAAHAITDAHAAPKCKSATPPLVAAISAGLDDGLTLRNVVAVRSRDFKKAYFVAGEVEGPGLEGSGDVGVWVTNSPSGNGLIYSVDAVAEEFSDWGPGGQTDAKFSMSDDGASAAQRCVQRA
jgi:hypothetical protein